MLKEKRCKVWLIYLIIIFLTLFMRIGFFYADELNDFELDAAWSCTLQIILFGIIPLTLYTAMISKKKIKDTFLDFGFKRTNWRNWLRAFALAHLMMFVANFISYTWHILLVLIGFHIPHIDTIYPNVGYLILDLFLSALLPGVFEEFTHRGLLFSAFSKEEKEKNKWLIVFISATMFALMHQNIRQTTYTFFGGVILALVCYYTKSIFPSMCMHFLNNYSATMQGYAEDHTSYFYTYINKGYDFLTGSVWGMAIFALLIAASVGLIILLLKGMKKEYTKDLNREKEKIQLALNENKTIDNFFLDEKPEMQIKKGFIKADYLLIVLFVMGIFATSFTLFWGIFK